MPHFTYYFFLQTIVFTYYSTYWLMRQRMVSECTGWLKVKYPTEKYAMSPQPVV